VHRGLIRVDADEMSYSLHIMHRYELEKQLLSGQLIVKELPEAWNAGMEQRFGRRPENFAEGCLQDVHWALGSFGYFPSYALGIVIAAQFWESLRSQVSRNSRRRSASGIFPACSGWLRENVHGLGAKVSVKELIKQASGHPLGPNALLRYLENKYQSADGVSELVPRELSHLQAPERAPARPCRQGDRRLSNDRGG
jgi:carboxypeptidase Taq